MPASAEAHNACAFCGAPAGLELLLVCARQVRAQVPVCNADAAAVALGEWTLQVKCMDRVRVLRGRDVGREQQGEPW